MQPTRLTVRQQQFEFLHISSGDNMAFPEVSFAFGRFPGHHMAGIGLGKLEFAGSGLFESFGRRSVGLYFWHCAFLLLYKID
jgi:hypothetical protein